MLIKMCNYFVFDNGSHENKRYVEEKEADIDCEERKEQEY